MNQPKKLPQVFTWQPQNVDRWKRTPTSKKSKSQGLPFPDLLQRIKHFLEDYLPHRVENYRSQSGSSLPFVFRHTADVNQKMSIKLHPILHFYRQHAQFVLNSMQFLSLSTSLKQVTLHQTGGLGVGEIKKDRSPFIHLKSMLFPQSQWQRVQTTKNQIQPGPLPQIFFYPHALPPIARNLFSQKEPPKILASPPKSIRLSPRRMSPEGFIRSPAGMQSLLNRDKEVGNTGQDQQAKILPMQKHVELLLKAKVSKEFGRREFNLIKTSEEISRIKILQSTFLRSPEENYIERSNSFLVLKDILATTKQVLHRFSSSEKHPRDFSLSYIFTNRQQDFRSILTSYRQTEEKTWVEYIQRQVHEESNRLERKFSVQVASPAELTDQVYNQLTRRLQIEKERLGY
jgi:hypothetical protein